jgi:hypothetical protein
VLTNTKVIKMADKTIFDIIDDMCTNAATTLRTTPSATYIAGKFNVRLVLKQMFTNYYHMSTRQEMFTKVFLPLIRKTLVDNYKIGLNNDWKMTTYMVSYNKLPCKELPPDEEYLCLIHENSPLLVPKKPAKAKKESDKKESDESDLDDD